MVTLSVYGTSSYSTLFDEYRLDGVSKNRLPSGMRSMVTYSGVDRSVVADRESHLSPGVPAKNRQPDSPGFFNSYIDILQQQRRSQAMISMSLSGAGRLTSLLENYVTLQYQRSVYDQVFNLKGDVFKSTFAVTV